MQILNLSATLNVASLEPSINTYRLGEGAGTYEYPELNNKPKINGVTLVGNISSANLGIKTSDLTNDSGFISEGDIPTATSDLVNDSGFVNATQVQSVVSDAIPSDISYFNNDVGYITNADIGNIPTRTSQLVNDSGYITAAEAPVVSVNNMTGVVVLDGTNIEYEQRVSLNAKIDAVEGSIPTQTSQLTNDSGFITKANVPTRTSQLVNDSGFINARNIPVQSVNGETGNVELTAADIDYDSNNTVAAKIDANAQAIDSNAQAIGDLSSLTTTHKDNLVSAINEIVSSTPVYGNMASGAIATFDTSLALPLQDCTIDINAVQKSGTPTPSSPKLISGFTGANIKVVGANLWDEEWEVKVTYIWSKNYIPIKPNTSYYRKSPNNIFPRFYDNSFTEIGTGIWGKDNTFTTPSNASYMKFMVDPAYGATYSNDISINYPATDTQYHAYNGNTYTVDFGQTVYGGYFDNKGNLVITHGYIASYNGESINEPWLSSMDDYVPNTSPSTGAQVVYPLTTPATYRLTPTQISAIVGTNNVYTDTNGNTSVVYACSLKDYIDGQ